MNEHKKNIINKIERISDDLNEMQIIERIYLLSRLEYSREQCKKEGVVFQNNGQRTHKYELAWSKVAIEDLDAAGIVAAELRQQAKALRKNPQKGTIIEELNEECYRELKYKKCNIVYEITDTTIIIHLIYNFTFISDRSFYKIHSL